MTVAGPIESVSIDGREFAVAADADANRQLGGFSNTVEPNGNGTARTIKARMPWRLEGLALAINDAKGDQEFLQAVADRPDNVPIAATFASGATYQGVGTIVDDIAFANQSATAPIALSGPGNLTPQ